MRVCILNVLDRNTVLFGDSEQGITFFYPVKSLKIAPNNCVVSYRVRFPLGNKQVRWIALDRIINFLWSAAVVPLVQ